MRRTLRAFGEYLQTATVNDTAKVILAVIAIIGAAFIALRQPQPLVVFLSPLILIGVLLLYFAVLFFSTEIVHWVGRKIVKVSKYYPAWFYRPEFEYYLGLGYDKTLTLYIKSLSRNKQAHLSLEFHRIKLVNATDEQKYQMDVDVRNLRSKWLYDKKIGSNDTMTVPISGKTVDGNDMLCFPFDNFGIRLFHGKYRYVFKEWGTYKGADFGGQTQTLEFVYNEKGEFEI